MGFVEAAGVPVCPKIAVEKIQSASAIPQIAGIVFLMRGESCSRKQVEPTATVNDSIRHPQRPATHENLRDRRGKIDGAEGYLLRSARGRDLLDPRAVRQREDDAPRTLRRA